jgi:hypothetical protein
VGVRPAGVIFANFKREMVQQHANPEKTLTMTVCAQHVWLFVRTDSREFR